MCALLSVALNRARTDDAIRSVLICGDENCFTAGNDLNDFLQADFSGADHPTFTFMKTMSRFKKPVIAAVAGPAVGIGTTLLLHCDFVVAADNSRFQMPFAPLGLCPEFGASLLLERFVGKRKAEELLLLGKPFSAAEAQQWGLVNQVCAPEALMESARHIAGSLAELPAHAIHATRSLLREGEQEVLEQHIDRELEIFRQCLPHPETRKRLEAFFKR